MLGEKLLTLAELRTCLHTLQTGSASLPALMYKFYTHGLRAKRILLAFGIPVKVFLIPITWKSDGRIAFVSISGLCNEPELAEIEPLIEICLEIASLPKASDLTEQHCQLTLQSTPQNGTVVPSDCCCVVFRRDEEIHKNEKYTKMRFVFAFLPGVLDSMRISPYPSRCRC